MFSRKEDYKTLGIQQNASEREVGRAYRRLVLKYHPDKVAASGGNAQEAANKFNAISEAYNRLLKNFEQIKKSQNEYKHQLFPSSNEIINLLKQYLLANERNIGKVRSYKSANELKVLGRLIGHLVSTNLVTQDNLSYIFEHSFEDFKYFDTVDRIIKIAQQAKFNIDFGILQSIWFYAKDILSVLMKIEDDPSLFTAENFKYLCESESETPSEVKCYIIEKLIKYGLASRGNLEKIRQLDNEEGRKDQNLILALSQLRKVFFVSYQKHFDMLYAAAIASNSSDHFVSFRYFQEIFSLLSEIGVEQMPLKEKLASVARICLLVEQNPAVSLGKLWYLFSLLKDLLSEDSVRQICDIAAIEDAEDLNILSGIVCRCHLQDVNVIDANNLLLNKENLQAIFAKSQHLRQILDKFTMHDGSITQSKLNEILNSFNPSFLSRYSTYAASGFSAAYSFFGKSLGIVRAPSVSCEPEVNSAREFKQ